MSWRLKLEYWLYKIVEPLFRRLEQAVQTERNRIARLEAIAKGTRLWKGYRERLAAASAVYAPDPAYANLSPDERYQKLQKLRQDRCKHRKGGHFKNIVIDYNLMDHTYVDGSRCIKCLSCGREWWSTDADWSTTWAMMDQSTNTASSCEVPIIGGPDNYRPEAQKEGSNGPNNLS